MEKILVTGANGQIGNVLCEKLREIHGAEQILASDITRASAENHPYVFLDILNKQRLSEIVGDHRITQIYHLAAILSANGEWNPLKTLDVNFNGLISILECARNFKLNKLFFPSTIGVFGSTTPKQQTAQDVPLLPSTVYGITKTSGELWCHYYHHKYGIDVRSIRYPGIIGHESMPSGGTTDYAVKIFHDAIKHKQYSCFLEADTRLPMIYMPDAIKATADIMQAPSDNISIRYGYNLSSMSFTPAEIAIEIKRHIPDFEIEYKPDFRQEIAESWVESIDDSQARNDWQWQPEYNLSTMVDDMFLHLKK